MLKCRNVKISKNKNIEDKIVETYILIIVLMFKITEDEYRNKNARYLKRK